MCNTIGERIGKLRTQKGVTQAQLGKALGVKRETVTQWENGERDLKTAATVKLADFFGVSCDYILRGIAAENLSINQELGLSNKAIEIIKFLKNQQDCYNSDNSEDKCFFPFALDILNSLIEKAEYNSFFSLLQAFASSAQWYRLPTPFKSDFGGMTFECDFDIYVSKYIEEHDPHLCDLLQKYGSVLLSGAESWEYRKQHYLSEISKYIETVIVAEYSNIDVEEKKKYVQRLKCCESMLKHYDEEDINANNNKEK